MNDIKKNVRLFTPGPTHVPEPVRQAISQAYIHHRSQEFEQCYLDIQQRFKNLLGENTQTTILTSSGSGAMEATVASFFNTGDEVVVIHAGKFGERWRDICLNYSLKVKEFVCPWGEAINSHEVIEWVKEHKPRAVLMQACETSTGVFHPVYALGKLLKKIDTLLIVDAITALGIYPFSLEHDGIDVLIGGSQKALMCPPGLASVSLNEKATSQLLKSSRSYYLSIQKELKAQKSGDTAYTPAVSLFFGLQQALTMLLKEGMGSVHARHQFLQRVSRTYFKAHGFKLFNKDHDAALGLTAVLTTDDFDVAQFLKQLKQEHNLWLAGGQGELQGKLFRFAHMGYCYPNDMIEALKNIDEYIKHQRHYNPEAIDEAVKELQRSSYENPHL
ncbi:MAG TPA: alanine--glyoxylate aminotransferase family protein [Oligoflexia bacterium]|nr:alanine--glyoxylate aminotransferase family protein [Oligoflexia bacterium]HMR24612.1 alanine--glyoxylate aminotransferase family protein [Oligoflexia bacterium]